MKNRRKIIEINEALCDGCGLCVPACAEGAIQIVDGKAKLVKDIFCDGLGACLGECPRGALAIIEREAEAFDESAVHDRLASLKKGPPGLNLHEHAGCPSMMIHFGSSPEKKKTTPERPSAGTASALAQWPVQIRLIPPSAPFLKNSSLLIAADCVPVAYGSFHEDFLAGRTVMLGCPKLDDWKFYLERFTEIFRQNDIRDITVLDMEVPCCSALPRIVKEALARAGKDIPVQEKIISISGKLK
ncbi:MAG TPA: 4Fe-4S binding protein [Syntrophales bacterium]|nr:4Fe-4S binding protein [Syntrophales bacterium]HOX95264.1 4Fe-4S binding protein [Syntrophales bacterium]HPI57921.1 4Fe-4S binding protein [Syntrophales bacterium]HPN24600.1 4Fe-4S binding protein [Syntrophales bacterium]HQM28906.1 4Fe-4S binding protein [Syntrophales bacterium]